MRNLLRISEAAWLAIHALASLSYRADPVQVSRLADSMGASRAHLGKVMQRLARTGLVNSVRGRKGGFVLAVQPENLSVLDVWEAVDGPLRRADCLLDHACCDTPGECHVRALSADLSAEILSRLGEMKLSDIDPTPGV
jgi:Rrf2 family transcriptional regulator, nitric oxide-sensitive transcriptional repressor